MLTREKYRNIFRFPVKAYYEKAGFNFKQEPFEKPAMEFIDLYHQKLDQAGLFPDVFPVLDYLKSNGLLQLVLSAMEHDSLVRSLDDKGIIRYFTEISGIDNHYAHSKLEIGQELIKKIDASESQFLIIGDSLHDLDVSKSLGIDCLLISNGHQSKEQLLSKTRNVIDEIKDVMGLFD